MNNTDHIIAELMNALDLILHEAQQETASRHYIQGVATQAMKNCNAHRARGRDGYLQVRRCALAPEGWTCAREYGHDGACDLSRPYSPGDLSRASTR